jgi:hypothetical protein
VELPPRPQPLSSRPSAPQPTLKGRAFEAHAKRALEIHLGESFDEQIDIAIGSPAKAHRFDLVSHSRRYVCEVKSYTWTKSGNIPSAKISTLREALSYLSQMSPGVRTILVMNRAVRPRHGETLAEYFVRLNLHLLGSTAVAELAENSPQLRILS